MAGAGDYKRLSRSADFQSFRIFETKAISVLNPFILCCIYELLMSRLTSGEGPIL